MPTDISMENVVEQDITNKYDVYGGYNTNRYIGTDTVGKIRKGINYYDELHKGS